MKFSQSRSNLKIQQEIFKILIVLVLVSTLFVATVSIFVNIESESRYLDQNLQNMAQAIAQSQPVQQELASYRSNDSRQKQVLHTYLDSLKESLSNIDVISVVGADNIRKYHTNASMVDTVYDGTIPEFQYGDDNVYVTSDIGPSGSQRRAYAAVYDYNGNYLGFVLAVMLNQNINRVIMNTVSIHLIGAAVVLFFAIVLSRHLSHKIKETLHGYEPDTFSAMFTIRENVLDSLDEGIIAVSNDKRIIYGNKAAQSILNIEQASLEGCRVEEISSELSWNDSLIEGDKVFGISIHPSQGSDVLVDQIPIMEQNNIVGALGILRDRTEYTKLIEDLSGVRYMVESMRANNHDFINKLHVILGLIQMGNTKEACEYITHITSIKQTVLQNIIKNVEDPSVAALLIGKYARACELNIQFILESGSKLSRSNISLPSGDLVTIIGNLLDNAMDSMNEKKELPKDLTVGLFSQPNVLIITVDDTGMGMKIEEQSKIYEKGFSTKGQNRGTGLFIVNNLIQKYNGTILVESEYGVGTSFTVTLND